MDLYATAMPWWYAFHMNVHPLAPIGVFDSGLGGLSVVRELRREVPRETVIYAADSRYVPYGERSTDQIRSRSLAMVAHLVERGVKLVVVACNTASAASIEILREHVTVPVVGLEPAVKPAVALTITGKIAVLSTPSTATSARLNNLIDRYGQGFDIRSIGVPGLADCIEAGDFESADVDARVRSLVEQQITDGVDVIVLGCTHYPFVQRKVREIAGPDVRIVDSGNAVARRVREILMTSGLLAPPGAEASISLDTTGDPAVVGPIASRMLGQNVPVSAIEVSSLTFVP